MPFSNEALNLYVDNVTRRFQVAINLVRAHLFLLRYYLQFQHWQNLHKLYNLNYHTESENRNRPMIS